MKNTVCLIAAASFLCSCGGITERPIGVIYTNAADPIAATASGGSRTGTAEATSYLGLVAVGDSSIEAAKKNGGITSVSSVDTHRKNILGVVTSYTTTVKGN